MLRVLQFNCMLKVKSILIIIIKHSKISVFLCSVFLWEEPNPFLTAAQLPTENPISITLPQCGIVNIHPGPRRLTFSHQSQLSECEVLRHGCTMIYYTYKWRHLKVAKSPGSNLQARPNAPYCEVNSVVHTCTYVPGCSPWTNAPLTHNGILTVIDRDAISTANCPSCMGFQLCIQGCLTKWNEVNRIEYNF